MNKIKIYGIYILICLVFASLLTNSSGAQSASNFLPYTNDDMGVTIQYPSNWLAVDDEKSPHESVSFKASNKTKFQIFIKKLEPYLDTDTMTLKNTSLQQYAQRYLDNVSSMFPDHKLIRQNNVTVGGNDGINAAQGDDELTGGGGADMFKCGSGVDTVTDFIEAEGDKASGNCEIL